MTMTADELIFFLDLEPHPEGGWYKETYRSKMHREGRCVMTAIYYLLRAGETSRWHRVKDADEVWTWIAGGVLSFARSIDGTHAEPLRLGMDLAGGALPQLVVPAGAWQTASTENDFVLVSCIVAPGFDFAGFEFAPSDFAPPKNPKISP